MPALISGRAFFREENKLFIKGGVSEVHIFLVKLLLDQLDSLAEVSNLSKSLRTHCLQGFRGFFGVRENRGDKPSFEESGCDRSPIRQLDLIGRLCR